MTIVIVTGGFDPLHSGHIAYLNAARRMGDKLAVGLNSDAWLVRKKGYAFLPMHERQQIVGNLKSVDHTFTFDDSDGTACDAIEQMLSFFPFHDILFANGGDRTEGNIPEMSLAGKHPVRLRFAFGVGGTIKVNSSRDILGNYKNFILGKTNNDKTELAASKTYSESGGRKEASETLQSYVDRRRQESKIISDLTVDGRPKPWPDVLSAGYGLPSRVDDNFSWKISDLKNDRPK